MASVEILEEVTEAIAEAGIEEGWHLCFQKCLYHLEEEVRPGYRFIWRKPGGNLQAARGQARIPNAATLERLTSAAKNEGWYR